MRLPERLVDVVGCCAGWVWPDRASSNEFDYRPDAGFPEVVAKDVCVVPASTRERIELRVRIVHLSINAA